MRPQRSKSRSSRGLTHAALASWLFLAAGTAASPAQAFIWPNVPEQIARALQSSDVSERRLGAQRLGELPPELALTLVQKAMADPDVEVRLRVAQAAIALRMAKAGDQVIGWLSEGDARLRLAACDVIRSAPTDRSVVALGRVLGDPDPHVRLAAAAAMGSSGLPDAVSPLLGHLDDPAPEVRAEVARALGRIGDSRAVVPLVGKVQDSVSDVRRVVARALGELGDKRAASALMLALQDSSQEVRVEAVGALGKLGSDEATLAIAPLVESTAEPEFMAPPPWGRSGMPQAVPSAGAGEVRVAALRALGKIGSEQALKVLVSALGKDDPATPRSAVRDAILLSGKSAIPVLIATLSGSPSPQTAAGAALVLGALKASQGAPVIVRSMQRGVLPLRFGLLALAGIGSDVALPTILELLDDADPAVRRAAARAGVTLLDPVRADGRAVDPAREVLADAATPMDEKIELVRLLGRTGAARAQKVLLSLTGTKSNGLRLAVLEALGTLRVSDPAVDEALLKALGDELPQVRLRAAIALARVASTDAAAKLLERLSVAAEQDRGAIGIALSGALSRANDPRLAEIVGLAVAIAPEAARDALIEGLGRMRGVASGRVLIKIAGGSTDDRRKVAEALAGHPETLAPLRALAVDADPSVRAAAVWSLGAVGKKADVALLVPHLKDPDIAVAGNAAAALGRIASREQGAAALVAAPLCALLGDSRAYVRANALGGLAIFAAQCDGSVVRDRLSRDPSESVRIAAANLLARSLKQSGASADADRRSLIRCAGEDRDGAVASRCAKPLEVPVEVEDVGVFVVSDGRDLPTPRAPFALLRGDGLLRLGIADRRGAFFEFGAPKGAIRLAVPASLVR